MFTQQNLNFPEGQVGRRPGLGPQQKPPVPSAGDPHLRASHPCSKKRGWGGGGRAPESFLPLHIPRPANELRKPLSAEMGGLDYYAARLSLFERFLEECVGLAQCVYIVFKERAPPDASDRLCGLHDIAILNLRGGSGLRISRFW